MFEIINNCKKRLSFNNITTIAAKKALAIIMVTESRITITVTFIQGTLGVIVTMPHYEPVYCL